jgi:hypothetical protein
MTINVTEECITEGVRKSSKDCMIGLALRTVVPQAQYVSVDTQAIRFSDPDTRERYMILTPPVGQRAILAWDAGSPIAPFKMTGLAPIRVREMGWQGQGNRTAPSRAGAKKKKKKPGRPREHRYARQREYGLRWFGE